MLIIYYLNSKTEQKPSYRQLLHEVLSAYFNRTISVIDKR